MMHKSVFKHVKDDSTPKEYEPNAPYNGYLIYLGVFDDKKYLGCFNFIRRNGATFEAHICLLPECYGKAREAGKKGVDWLFENGPCQRIIAEVPETNIQARKMASDIGFELYGVNTRSIQKNDKLLDVYCYGISKG